MGPKELQEAGFDDIGGLLFVVHQHRARRMHYDLRLELGGRLVCWAVPKGPSMDPGQRRLAVRVEDHPLSHADFEGVIPEGEYGAGEVIVWDRGTWRPLDECPEEALRAGKLLFLLGGHKLRGRFVLVRTRYKGERENWLLIKLKDRYARPGEDITLQRPESVLTGRTITDLRLWWQAVKEVGEEVERVAGAERTPMPLSLPPMWPGAVRRPFCQSGWLFEIEVPGTRALAFCDGSTVTIRDARQRDISQLAVPVVHFLANMRLPRAVIDGVLTGLAASGGAGEEKVPAAAGQAEQGQPAPQPVLHAFDLLHFGDCSLLTSPLSERRRLLSKLVPDAGPVRFVDHIAIEGEAACREAAKLRVRAVAKKADSVYRPGEHSEDWALVEPPAEAREPTPAVPSASEALALAEEIRAIRHRSATMRVGDAAVKLTNLDKVFWPPRNGEQPLLKRDLIAYYAEVSPWLLGYLHDRPLTLRRYVDGIEGDSFYQRDWPYRAPEYVRLVPIYAPSAERDVRAVVCDNLPTLLWLANTADIEMHAWYARCSNDGQGWREDFSGSAEAVEESSLNYPDYVVFDLDPWVKAVEGGGPQQRLAGLEACKQVARLLRERLEKLGLAAYVKTSGKTGLHIWVPIERRYRYEVTRDMARRMAEDLARMHPQLVTTEWRVEKRHGKVLIDHMQNVRGKTLPAPYSLRATAVASVSMPLSWDELQGADAWDFTLLTVPELLRERGDRWTGMMDSRGSLGRALAALGVL